VLRYQLWPRAAITVAVIAFIVHSTATPVAGIGIAVPVVATEILALVLSHDYAAPLAYIGGSMGTLIGADILNLDKIGSLGAPIASIGGAGTFDGIFPTGILAVLLAGLASPSRLRSIANFHLGQIQIASGARPASTRDDLSALSRRGHLAARYSICQLTVPDRDQHRSTTVHQPHT
jgi:Protein of unknown function (DUF1614)